MFFENFLNTVNNSPDKTAIVYNDIRYNYRQFWCLINSKTIPEYDTYLLTCQNELDNLINFLALIFNGKRAIWASKNLSFDQKQEIIQNHSCFELNNLLPKDLKSSVNFPDLKHSDIFLGVLSSGTTGTPKVIWKDFQSWFEAFPIQTEIFGIDKNDTVFVNNALSYSANLNSVLHAFWCGGTLVLSDLSKIKNWVGIIEKEKVSSIFLVPSHYRLLTSENQYYGTVKSLVSAGEKLDSNTAQKLIDIFPNATLTEYYGSSELGHISYQQNEDIIQNPMSVGKAFPKVNIEIVDGVIRVNSPFVSPDYRTINTNNDFAEWQNGRLVILGRAGRMFNRRGLNIYSEEIEVNALMAPFVLETAALQHTKNQKIYLYFTLKPEFRGIFSKDLKEFLYHKLPASKQPNFIFQVDSLPTLVSGKINIAALSKKMDEEEIV